ncbi:ABC-type transport system involved in multi-copper enzyme maturation, permease component [Bradyrhizobium brasilense]|uniref:ABC-type transport system involved in multi-copper enzyme maturation, permease component n=1 Tax=Bradyrhizobium brasilense TaxID=1419277 RepID=A0A1G7Q075_9BRAD|nr:ABC transporter permease subunit [Bradyrhizobium brasilense]SDF91904.1 ABC-type transport system involved in multi-copper enzyme maturation, permease component [Bradyrhizobium brasilense]
MRLPKPYAQAAPLRPLLAKEIREILGGRSLWTMLLLLCPLIGYSFYQAVSLYSESSSAALESPALATSLSPLDGILVPTLGSFYVAVTLLFPFVAIRVLGQEKESGALRLLLQLPYRIPTLVIVKLLTVVMAWLLASLPALSALVVWRVQGGHLSFAETSNLLFGHLLYGTLVGALSLCAASMAESAATAAIIALAVTIGSWALDFTIAGQPGLLAWIAKLSLTQTLRPFEQGLFSGGLLLGIAGVIGGLVALASVWLPPGVPLRRKIRRSVACGLTIAAILGAATQTRWSVDVTEDRRNSFASADEQLLATLRLPLLISVRLAPEDPRYADLQRNVLSKLERTMPNVSVWLADSRHYATGSSDESYGQVEYTYRDRSDVSRSTSPREILPLIYGLAGVSRPSPISGGEYPGYPLVVGANVALLWFCGALPLLIALGWWRSRRPRRIDFCPVHEGGPS